MHDSRVVRFGQSAGDLNGNIQRLTQSYRTTFQKLAQRPSVDEFGGDDLGVVDLINLKYSNNVWMVERRGRARLLFEALHPLSIPSELFRQEFERHLASQPRVLRKINYSHSAST